MIGLPAGTRIWLAAGITDMRAGMNGLAAKVETALAEDPYCGHVFVSAAGAEICSRYFGGPAMAYACSQSASNEAASSGRRRTAAASP
jgi:transposase